MNAQIFTNPMFKGCALGGISEHAAQVTVVNVPGSPPPPAGHPSYEKAPAVILESHVCGAVRAVPAVYRDGKWQRDTSTMWQMGGAFMGTSDSRFSDAVERLLGHRMYGAIALHDRAANKEQRIGYDD